MQVNLEPDNYFLLLNSIDGVNDSWTNSLIHAQVDHQGEVVILSVNLPPRRLLKYQILPSHCSNSAISTMAELSKLVINIPRVGVVS